MLSHPMLLLTATSTAILQTQMTVTNSIAPMITAFVLLIFAGALALMRLADCLADRQTPVISLRRASRPVRSFQGPAARRF
jgi:hypothetical protein